MSGLFRVGGDEYDNFMGRYSRVLATLFADFAGVTSGMRVLDVGAGTGALTAELVARGASVAAADPSPEFGAVLRERFPNLEVEEAPAESLPYGAGVFELALAQLVVAFVSDGPAAIAEMARVARRVAVCMWGVEEVDMFAAIDRAAETVGASRATEPRRYRTAQEIHDLLAPHGAVDTAELDVTAGYGDFEEFWEAMGHGVGPAGQWLASLDPEQREQAHAELFRDFGSPQGPFELNARAFAAAVTPS
ncbi:MAG TPA: class I SAM-dependent methyltransferase [Gaiellaceae bacterium]